MRLIDADELKTWFGEKDLYSYDYIIDTINDAPTIEPERKKGKWRRMPMACYGGGMITEYECSVCKEHEIVETNFCPNCGADMREGDTK